MFAEDLTVFFDTVNGFAVPATLQGGAAGGVAVIFDAVYLEQFDVIANTGPVALGIASLFPSSVIGKTLAIDGITYTIRNREPQEDGALVLLRLERSA